MGERRMNYFEKCYRILEYLRRNSDKEHPLKQAELYDAEELKECINNKSKDLFRDYIQALAATLNCSADDETYYYENKCEARIAYGTKLEAFDKMTNLYYNHEFSHQEINLIEDGILASRLIDNKKAKVLMNKIESNLTNKYYKRRAIDVSKSKSVTEKEDERLKENLQTITRAIRKKIQIRITFRGHDKYNNLDMSSGDEASLSPYYIVVDSGRYYLLCTYEPPGVKNHKMYILRIDLMTNVSIPEYMPRSKDKKGIAVTPKENVEGLPGKIDDAFFANHLNMSYGDSHSVLLRVKIKDKKRGKLSYTFLHDYFGSTYKYIESDPDDSDYARVRVECTDFAMVNWALQYSDRVEVIEPESLRVKMKEKVVKLAWMYGASDREVQ